MATISQLEQQRAAKQAQLEETQGRLTGAENNYATSANAVGSIAQSFKDRIRERFAKKSQLVAGLEGKIANAQTAGTNELTRLKDSNIDPQNKLALARQATAMANQQVGIAGSDVQSQLGSIGGVLDSLTTALQTENEKKANELMMLREQYKRMFDEQNALVSELQNAQQISRMGSSQEQKYPYTLKDGTVVMLTAAQRVAMEGGDTSIDDPSLSAWTNLQTEATNQYGEQASPVQIQDYIYRQLMQPSVLSDNSNVKQSVWERWNAYRQAMGLDNQDVSMAPQLGTLSPLASTNSSPMQTLGNGSYLSQAQQLYGIK